jgi:hypothetical protein
LIGKLRRRVGNPTQNEVPDRELQETLSSSLEWLAGYLRFCQVTDLDIPLVSSQMEYTIPRDCLYMSWVQIGQNLLQPTSTWAINSGAVTTQTAQQSRSWLTATPSTPTRYAIEGRELILNPPPSATFVAATPFMSWRYIGTDSIWTEQSEVGMGVNGSPGLSALDEDLVMYYAASEWLGMRLVNVKPDQLPPIQAQIAELKDQISRRLPEAKRRWEARISDYLPTARPDTSGRMYAAR